MQEKKMSTSDVSNRKYLPVTKKITVVSSKGKKPINQYFNDI